MSKSYMGGCGCGALRYEVSAEPMMANDCHCRQCQRDSGTGHGSYLTFPRAAVTVTGEAKSFDFVGDNGTVKARAFCPSCGTPVYMLFPSMPEIFIVRAGTLDEPERYQARMVLWTATATTWDRIAPDVPAFEKMPPPAG
jgi:hypothetical protein